MPYFAVAIGGFLGAITRYIFSEWLGTQHGFPFATLIINILGSFVLMWFYTLTLERLVVHPHIRLGVGTGFVGAFTTFSTFSVETWTLVKSGAYGLAVLYVLLSLVFGILFSLLGYTLAERQTRLLRARGGRGNLR